MKTLGVGVCVLLLAVSLVAVVGGGVAAETDRSPVVFQQSALPADEVRITVDVHEDGAATWQLGFWRVLADDDSRAAFDALRADIRADPGNYTEPFAGRIERTVDAASNATGREMAVDNVTVETDRQSVAREYGVVRYRFEWDGFARVDGDELAAGDAIDRLYLDDGTRLLLRWPEGYDLQSVAPEPDDRRETAVLWEGSDTEFIAGEPRVVLTPAGPSAGTLAGLLGVIAVLAGAGGWLLRRRSAETRPAAETDETPPATAEEVDEASETDAEAQPQSTEGHAADQSTERAAETEPDPSLLSNEEQVMRLLEANGGRMKQQTVVEELGWTDAKTSKVVSGMREAGTIESFRIGRENVLTTPEDDPRESSP